MLFKIPKDIANASPLHRKMYAVFLDFKAFADSGRFTKAQLYRRVADRHYYRYWLNKFIEEGWILDRGDYYQCLSYPGVWNKMNLNRFFLRKLNLLKFTYIKIDANELKDNRKDYLSQIREAISNLIIDRKTRQIRRMLKKPERHKANEHKNTAPTCPVSCKKIAEWFGFRSPKTGLSLRRKLLKGRTQDVPGFVISGKVIKRHCSLLYV